MFHLSDFDLALTDGLLLGLLIPVCIYLAYQVYRPGAGRWRGAWWLMVLRGLAFVLLLALMMEPTLAVTVQRQRNPLVAFLVDNSESMQVEEGGKARRDKALDLLQGDAVRDLEARARVVRYRFSDALHPLSEAGVDSLLWDGRATDIAGALDALREVTAGEGLVAAFSISDGAHNLGGRPERAAVDLGAPIFAVGIGDAEPPKDLALVSAVIDPLGYVGREISISVGLKVSGFGGVQDLLVLEEGGRRVAAEPITLSEGEQTVRFQVRPERAGRHAYRISMAPQPGERSRENNLVIVSTEVLESRVRVLMVAGSPSVDLAYLRRCLEADPNLELEVVFATWSGEWSYRMRDLLSRPDDRDLVILFDLPRAILSGTPERRLAAFVRAGGGVLVVGGEIHQGYALSPLAEVLPLAFSGEDHTYRVDPFQVEIPKAAYRHPILRISDDPLADRLEWAELPPLLAYNQNRGVRPGAVVLLQHPTERVGNKKMPLVAVTRAGAGKAMAVAFRTFWRFGLMMWGIGKTDVISQTFWGNAVRWLVIREDVARVRAVPDKPIYRSGEPVTFHAQVFDELLQPQQGATVTVLVAQDGDVREVALKDEGEGRYSGRMGGMLQGDYAFQVRAVKGAADLGGGTGRFTVGRYSLEYEEVRMNAELLQDLAANSGGAFVRPDAFPAAVRDLSLAPQPVTVRYRSRLWGQAWPFFLLVCLLAVEWTVRRRRRMI